MLPTFLATWWGFLTRKMSEHAVSWNSTYYSQSYKCLLFYEKIDIFENFENFRFWNFLKKFSILRHSQFHNMIWKLSWYEIINMFYNILSISDINCRLIWGRNMKIYPHVEVGTQKYPLGSKGLKLKNQILKRNNPSMTLKLFEVYEYSYKIIKNSYMINVTMKNWFVRNQPNLQQK